MKLKRVYQEAQPLAHSKFILLEASAWSEGRSGGWCIETTRRSMIIIWGDNGCQVVLNYLIYHIYRGHQLGPKTAGTSIIMKEDYNIIINPRVLSEALTPVLPNVKIRCKPFLRPIKREVNQSIQNERAALFASTIQLRKASELISGFMSLNGNESECVQIR